MQENKYGFHETHCCALHGCKYGDEDCPVAILEIQQQYRCEDCRDYFKPANKHMIFVSVSYAEEFENDNRNHYVYKNSEQVILKGDFLIFRVIDEKNELTGIQYRYAASCVDVLENVSIISLTRY